MESCNHVSAILHALEDFNRKKLKTFVEPLTCTSHSSNLDVLWTRILLKWNVLRDPSINLTFTDKTHVKKSKFGGNLSTEVLPKNNCYDSRAPNDKHLDNDSMNTLKRELQKSLPFIGFFFYFMTVSPNVQKMMKKKKLNLKLLKLFMDMKQIITLTFWFKLPMIFPGLLMNFIFHQNLLEVLLVNKLMVFH